MKLLEWMGKHPVLTVVLFLMFDWFVMDIVHAVKGCH